MTIFVTEKEVLELAYEELNMMRPNPDKVHDIAERMNMIYNEVLDLYEDVEEVSLRKYLRKIKQAESTDSEMSNFDKAIKDTVEGKGKPFAFTST